MLKNMIKALAATGLLLASASSFGAASNLTNVYADNITETSATLHGTIWNGSGSYPLDGGFAWGPTSAYGNVTPLTTISPNQTLALSQPISGLTCGTTYHFNGYWQGTPVSVWGFPDVTFTTAACAPVTPPPAAQPVYQLRTRYQGVRAPN